MILNTSGCCKKKNQNKILKKKEKKIHETLKACCVLVRSFFNTEKYGIFFF